MKVYLDTLRAVRDHGEYRVDRTGTGTAALFAPPAMRFDLRRGFPLVTTKHVNFEAVRRELLWFLSGSTNVNDLHPCRIWDPWADENGELGAVYGSQWRNWGGYSGDLRGYDQISALVRGLREDPYSRRHIVSAWNVAEIDHMALPPCHMMFQCYVSQGTWLDMQMYQRSADMAVGVPFNIASYALLLSILAQDVGLRPRYYAHVLGDAHVYLNHIEGVYLQLERKPHPPPRVEIARKPWDALEPGDITLHGYVSEPAIKFEVAV